MADSDPNPLEAFRSQLRAAGVDPDAPTWRARHAPDLSQLPALRRQRELLEAVRSALRAELDEARAELEAARGAAAELRHGGGR